MLFKKHVKKKKIEEPIESRDDVFDLEKDAFGDDLDFNRVSIGGKIRDFGRGFSTTVLNKQSRKNLLRGVLTGALPDEYNQIISAGEGAWDAVKRTVTRAQEDNASELLNLTAKAERNLHKVRGQLPSSAYGRIERKLEEKREFFSGRVKEEAARRRGVTTGISDEENLANTLADTFAVAEASRAQDEQEGVLRRDVKESLRHQEESVRFQASLEVLQGIRDDIGRQTSFQDSFLARYQRKMLEVSYRSYFALRDIRRLTGVGLDFNRMASESIIHNTSLTDARKSTHAISRVDSGQVNSAIEETGAARRGFSYTDQFKRQATNEAYKRYRGVLANYQAEFWPQVQDNIQRNIRDTLMGIDAASSMSGGINMRDLPPEMAGQEAGNLGSSLMGRYVMPRLARRFAPQMENLSNRLNGRNHLASYAFNNAQSILQDFAYDVNSDDGSITGILRGLARAHTPEYRLDGKLPGASYKALEKPVSFNNMSQRSLVDIIPGYLSRILHVAKMIQTGDDTIGRDVYDITKGTFVTERSAKSSMRSRIVTERERENIRTTLDDVVGIYRGDEELSDEAQYAFRDKLMRDAALGDRFDPEKFIRGEFGEGTTDETREELINFMRRRFDFDDEDKLVRETENLRQLNEFSNEFMRIRDVIPSSREEIERIHGVGSQELMREMGIIYTQHGQDYINYNKLWEMYRGDDTLGGTPPGTPLPPDEPLEGDDDEEGERFTSPTDMLKNIAKHRLGGLSGKEDTVRRGNKTARPTRGNARRPVDDTDVSEQPTTDSREETTSTSEPTPKRFKFLNSEHRSFNVDAIDEPTAIEDTQTVEKEHPTEDTIPKREQFTGRSERLVSRMTDYINQKRKSVKPLWDKTPDSETSQEEIARRRDEGEELSVEDLVETHSRHSRQDEKDTTSDASTEREPINLSFKEALQGKVGKSKVVINTLKDIYSKLGKRLLLRRDIENRIYVDVNTGRAVESIDDITGEVVDADGNIAITQEDFDRGLFDVHGNAQKSNTLNIRETLRRAAESVENTKAKGYVDRAKEAQDKLRKAKTDVTGSSWFKRTKDAFGKSNKDAYLPGEKEPRLTVKALKQGYYTNRKGKVISHFDDIDDDTIFDINMNVVVVGEELEHLVDAFGEKHPIAKNRGIRGGIGRLARNAVRGYANWTKNYYKKLPGRLARVGKFGFDKTFGAVGRKMGLLKPKETPEESGMARAGEAMADRSNSFYKPTERGKAQWDQFDRDNQTDGPTVANPTPKETEDVKLDPKKRGFMGRAYRWMRNDKYDVDGNSLKTPTDALLNRINENLEEQNEEHRKGSWQDILARRNKGEEETTNEENNLVKETAKEGGLFAGLKGLLGTIGSLFGLGAAGTGAGSLLGGLGSLLGGGDKSNTPGTRKGWLKRTWDGLLGRDGGSRTGKLLRYGGAGAMWLGRAALTIAGVVAGSTAGLALLGATIVGYGGYKLWQRYQETNGKLYAIRFRQYGIEPKERAQAVPVLELEAAMEANTQRDSQGNVSIDVNRINFEEILESFGFSEENSDRVNGFVAWFEGRFLPVYQAHQKALGEMGVDYKLTKLEDDITVEHAVEYIDMIRNAANGALSVRESPLPTLESLTSSDLAIEEAIEEAVEYYKKKEKRDGTYEQRKKMARWGLIDPEPGMFDEDEKKEGSKEEPEVKFGTLGDHMKALDGDKSTARSNVAQQARVRSLSFLQKLRGYAYGLSHFDDDYMEGLLSLEDAVLEKTSFGSDGQAEFNGSADQLLSDNAEKLGIVWSFRSPVKRIWRNWFNNRFITVFLAYAGKARQLDRAVRLNGSGSQMSKGNQLKVARAIVAAKKEGWFSDTPIWETDEGRFITHDPEQSLILAEELIREFSSAERAASVSKNPMPKPGLANQNQSGNEEGEEGEGLVSKDAGMITRAHAYYQGAGQFGGGLTRQQSGGYGAAGVQPPMTPGGQAQPRGAVYGGLLEGTGGEFENLPLPTKDQDRDAAMPTLQGVQEMTGVDANLLATFAKIESNFRAAVKAPTSSATGWFQFLNATWDEMIEKHGAKYGIPTDLPKDERRELRKDPRINALMGAEFLKGNHAYLSRHIGREPTDADLYLAHFMGMGGARKLLSADMNARADRLFPDPAASNPTVFYHGGERSRPRTVGDMIEWADSKVAPGRVDGAGQMVSSHHTPDQAVTPVTETGSSSPTVDVSGVDAMMGGNAPSSRGPSNVDIYGNDSLPEIGQPGGGNTGEVETQEGDVGEDRYSQAYGAATNAPDPYGSRASMGTLSTPRPQGESDFTEVENQRQQRFNEVRETERRQRERLEESAKETNAMGSISQLQLDEQIKMSGYLKTIAETLGVEGGLTPPRPSNDTSIPPQTTSQQTNRPRPARTGPTAYSERETAGVSMERD